MAEAVAGVFAGQGESGGFVDPARRGLSGGGPQRDSRVPGTSGEGQDSVHQFGADPEPARGRGDQERAQLGHAGLAAAVDRLWRWLSAPDHQPLLRLWTEAYARSLVDPQGPWSGFAHTTVDEWLTLLANFQPPGERDTPDALAARTLALAVLRGALLDLLATGDEPRATTAVRHHVLSLRH